MSLYEQTGYRRRRARLSQAFAVVCLSATVLCVLVLVWLLGHVLYHGLPWVSWNLLTKGPSRFPEEAGILPALVSSVWLIVLTALISVPIGVGPRRGRCAAGGGVTAANRRSADRAAAPP